MMVDLEHRQTSICEMTKVQRGAVIRAWADAIGASEAFEQMGRVGKVTSVDEINSLLALSDWPSADSTPMELAWLSIPVPDSKGNYIESYTRRIIETPAPMHRGFIAYWPHRQAT